MTILLAAYLSGAVLMSAMVAMALTRDWRRCRVREDPAVGAVIVLLVILLWPVTLVLLQRFRRRP